MQKIKRFIRRNEVLSKTGISASSIYNLEKSGEFPQHVMITPKCAGWYESDVDDWIASRKSNPAVISNFPDVHLRIAKNKLAKNSHK